MTTKKQTKRAKKSDYVKIEVGLNMYAYLPRNGFYVQEAPNGVRVHLLSDSASTSPWVISPEAWGKLKKELGL